MSLSFFSLFVSFSSIACLSKEKTSTRKYVRGRLLNYRQLCPSFSHPVGRRPFMYAPLQVHIGVLNDHVIFINREHLFKSIIYILFQFHQLARLVFFFISSQLISLTYRSLIYPIELLVLLFVHC